MSIEYPQETYLKLLKITEYEAKKRSANPYDYNNWAWDMDEVYNELHIVFSPEEIQRIFANRDLVITPDGRYMLRDFKAWLKRLEMYRAEQTHKEKAETENVSEMLDNINYESIERKLNILVGHDQLKKLIIRSLKTVGVHFLIVGPPATGKTLILDILSSLPGAVRVNGEATTKAGLKDMLIETEYVRYIVIDELDKMKPQDLTILLNLMDTGRFIVTQHGKRIDKKLDVNVYASANRIDKIKKQYPELLSRFLVFQFREYTIDQLKEIFIKVMEDIEKVPHEFAVYASEKLISMGFRDPRDARKLAKLMVKPDGTLLISSKRDIDEIINTIREYRSI